MASAAPLLGANAAPSVTVDCGSSTIARCDFVGHEPLDTFAARVCSTGPPVILSAKPFVFQSSQPVEAIIDWLDLDKNLHFEIVATRRVHLQPAASVLVADQIRSRWIRVSPEGASPITMPARTLSAERPVDVSSQAGGEVVVGVPAGSIRAEHIELTGRDHVWLQVGSEALVPKSGLFAGTYQVLPIYAGGLKGRPTQVVVESSKSSFAVLPSEPLGGIAAQVDSDACPKVTALRLSRIVGENDQLVLRNENLVDCEWKVAGLSPGRYRVIAESANIVLANSTVDVAVQQWAETHLVSSTIRVTGRILLNGKPAQGMRLAFHGTQDAPTAVVTDGGGAYGVDLPKKGSYDIQLRSLPFLGTQNIRQVFNQISNTFDWDITGGLIEVEISGWNEPSPIQLVIDGPTHTAGIVTREDVGFGEKIFKIYALKFGEYKVSASLPSGRVSRSPQTANLTDSSPSAKVLLELVDNFGELTVRDFANVPVTGARVLAGARRLPEQSPGVYSMRGVAPGTPMTITATGYVPSCVLSVPNTVNGALLTNSAEVAELVYPKAISFPPGEFGGVPGATCPVPASFFAWSLSNRDTSSTSVRFTNLPPVRDLTYDPGGLPQRLIPGPDGKVLIRLPSIFQR